MEQIKGYRVLSADEITLVNRIKLYAEEAGRLVAELRIPGSDADPRWVSIGATHLQEGFMALTRAVTKPTSF